MSKKKEVTSDRSKWNLTQEEWDKVHKLDEETRQHEAACKLNPKLRRAF